MIFERLQQMPVFSQLRERILAFVRSNDTFAEFWGQYGFWVALGFSGLLLLLLFANAEVVLKGRESSSGSAISTVGEEEPGPQRVVKTVKLSILTEPEEASVFINGDSIGVTPLQDLALRNGVHLLKIKRARYPTKDTLVILERDITSMQFFLEEGGRTIVSARDVVVDSTSDT